MHPQGEKRKSSSAAGKEIADLTRSERKRVVFCTRKEKSEETAARQARFSDAADAESLCLRLLQNESAIFQTPVNHAAIPAARDKTGEKCARPARAFKIKAKATRSAKKPACAGADR